jgi:tetratricopeptide (TPR) repeat protein
MQASGKTTSAVESYQRAINLNSDSAQAHYNLATAYEDILDFDAALTEYQTAIRADPALYAAQVNLARLYNLRKLDYASALRLLNTALALKPAAVDTQYSLYKNRGWAHFGLKLYGLAEEDLRKALALRADGAAAHCLLAQVLEAKSQREAALASWDQCLAFDTAGEGVEADWHAMAQERLAGGKPR